MGSDFALDSLRCHQLSIVFGCNHVDQLATGSLEISIPMKRETVSMMAPDRPLLALIRARRDGSVDCSGSTDDSGTWRPTLRFGLEDPSPDGLPGSSSLPSWLFLP